MSIDQRILVPVASGVAADTFITEVFGERVSDVVADQARAWKADLVVIGTHGRLGARRMVLGSDAEQIVRTVPGRCC